MERSSHTQSARMLHDIFYLTRHARLAPWPHWFHSLAREASNEKVAEVLWATRTKAQLEKEHGAEKAKVYMQDAENNDRMAKSRLFPNDPEENEYLAQVSRILSLQEKPLTRTSLLCHIFLANLKSCALKLTL